MIKRILIICPQFSDEYVHYQPWKQITQLSTELIKLKIDVAIGTESSDKQIIQNIPIINFKQKNLRTLNKNSKEKIIQFNPDIIYWVGNNLSGYYLKNISIHNIPIVVYISTFHPIFSDLKYFTIKEKFQFNLINLLTSFSSFKFIIKNLNHENIKKIIVADKTIGERLIQLGVNSSKLITSPLFFQPDFKIPDIKFDYTKTPFTLCYLGPHDSIRGTRILLDAIKLLKNPSIQLQFLLRTTNINDEKIISDYVKKLEISDNVQIHSGLLSRSFLVEKIINSHLVVIPPKLVWNEPPLAILESMILGTPVIGTRVGGIPEIIGKNGFIVNPTSNELSSLIDELIKNPHVLSELSFTAKQFTSNLPGWNKMSIWVAETLEKIKSS
jgi:glycosyltransferase involved in cell wall biosynthesis